jgi:hypothetical protein
LSRPVKQPIAIRTFSIYGTRNLIVEAINMILAGEITPGRLMLRDYINATGAMSESSPLNDSCSFLFENGNATDVDYLDFH